MQVNIKPIKPCGHIRKGEVFYHEKAYYIKVYGVFGVEGLEDLERNRYHNVNAIDLETGLGCYIHYETEVHPLNAELNKRTEEDA